MDAAVTIRNPGLMTMIVDLGRNGYSDMGVPSSAALDGYACRALAALLDSPDTPVLEVTGPRFALRFDAEVTCAITGARVKAFLDDVPLLPWASFRAGRGSILRVREITEGFRYYIGFAGGLKIDRVMGSYTTNLECRFGGYEGRTLMGGDVLSLAAPGQPDIRILPDHLIPPMASPHRLRVISGPESDYFTSDSLATFWDKDPQELFSTSRHLNRTGIRMKGKPLLFRPEVPKSIISEGILPGTVQIPGDGLPIVMLYERTIGGYARVATVIRADRDRLAHLRPGDMVYFERITIEEAEASWKEKKDRMEAFPLSGK